MLLLTLALSLLNCFITCLNLSRDSVRVFLRFRDPFLATVPAFALIPPPWGPSVAAPP